MPIVRRFGTLIPSNARNSDVAKDMTERVVSMQQQKMQAAFRVQGIDGILYIAMQSGRPCHCKSPKKTVAKLTQDGLASSGIMNDILTNNQFGIQDYNNDILEAQKNQSLSEESSFNSFSNYVGPENSVANQLSYTDEVAGDNGYFDPNISLDDLVRNFDYDLIGYSDVACPICFGTGYIGGYIPLRTWRKVFQLTDLDIIGDIDTTPYVWTLDPEPIEFHTILPKGACSVDAFRVMNGIKAVRSQVFIDKQEITGDLQLLSYCDGLEHNIKFIPTEMLTHVEIQFALTKEQSYFEVPKISKSGDLSFLEQSEAFQILLSPDVPKLSARDIIVESQLGKALIVGSTTPWQTKLRKGLGWECTIRVTQPMEIYNCLPRRGKIHEASTINMVRNTRIKQSSGVRSNYFNSTI